MVSDRALAAIVLAAGEGTRMKSDIAKVLHKVCGKTMIRYVLETVFCIEPQRVVVVIGHQAEAVRRELKDFDVDFAYQAERLGTAHAVSMAEPYFDNFSGDIIVLNGDTPLLKPETLKKFIGFHMRSGASATVLTARLDDPSGYGRIVRTDGGELLRIVEEKDASKNERAIQEINSGLFCFCADDLFSVIKKIDKRNAQGEFYITDSIEILKGLGKKVAAFLSDQKNEVLGINTVEQLQIAERLMSSDG